MARTPIAWTQLVSAHRKAQVAHDAMHDRALPQTEIDRQTIEFGRALDELFAAMRALSEAGHIARISLWLHTPGGRA